MFQLDFLHQNAFDLRFSKKKARTFANEEKSASLWWKFVLKLVSNCNITIIWNEFGSFSVKSFFLHVCDIKWYRHIETVYSRPQKQKRVALSIFFVLNCIRRMFNILVSNYVWYRFFQFNAIWFCCCFFFLSFYAIEWKCVEGK